jgi:hypothetical protein
MGYHWLSGTVSSASHTITRGDVWHSKIFSTTTLLQLCVSDEVCHMRSAKSFQERASSSEAVYDDFYHLEHYIL